MSQNQQQHQRISHTLKITPQQVAATAQLLDEGATVPFISRYRKEVTGSLNETQVAAIREKRGQTTIDCVLGCVGRSFL